VSLAPEGALVDGTLVEGTLGGGMLGGGVLGAGVVAAGAVDAGAVDAGAVDAGGLALRAGADGGGSFDCADAVRGRSAPAPNATRAASDIGTRPLVVTVTVRWRRKSMWAPF
jgi:hypothetical protein